MRLANVSLTLYSIYCTMLIVFNSCDIVNGQKTSLDSKFIYQYRAIRSSLFKFIGRSDTNAIYNYNLKTSVSCFLTPFYIFAMVFDIFIQIFLNPLYTESAKTFFKINKIPM